MRLILAISFILYSQLNYAQRHSLEGVWQGIITTYLEKPSEGQAIWMNFQINSKEGDLTGESRYEVPYKEHFAYKRLDGQVLSDTSIHFSEINVRKKKEGSHQIWCINDGDLTYNRVTGYLEGKWVSTDCKSPGGRIILYRSKYEMSRTDTNSLYHSWVDNFVGDLKRGWKAYYVRDAEMRDFQFVPVYFDHDMDDLKVDFEPYLNQMSKIVMSHSDLRIKIIGHTDSNGSDEYNINLSERRAFRIRDFLISQGVQPDRIVIEYRGERDPATSNKTAQGKSLNRRVDFEFI